MKKVVLSLASVALMTLVSCDNFNQAKKSATDTMEKVQQEAGETMDEIGDKMNQMKEDAGEALENAQEKVKDMISKIEVPKFSSNEAQKVADDYSKFLKEKAEALKSGSAEKVEEFKAKTAEWKAKMEEVGSKLTSEDATKWSEWKQKISEFEL